MATESKAMMAFREDVISRLSGLQVEATNVVQRLDKLNGSVARQESEIGLLKIADVKHDVITAQVPSLLADLTALKIAETKTTEQIQMTTKAAKAIWGVVGGSAILLFQHLPQLFKLLDAPAK